MTEQEFELQKQIWELKNQNTGLAGSLAALGLITLILILYTIFTIYENNESK